MTRLATIPRKRKYVIYYISFFIVNMTTFCLEQSLSCHLLGMALQKCTKSKKLTTDERDLKEEKMFKQKTTPERAQ